MVCVNLTFARIFKTGLTAKENFLQQERMSNFLITSIVGSIVLTLLPTKGIGLKIWIGRRVFSWNPRLPKGVGCTNNQICLSYAKALDDEYQNYGRNC